VTIRHGDRFKPFKGQKLTTVLNKLSKTYRSGGVSKVGLHAPLAELVGSSVDANGEELHSLEQVPGIKMTLYNGTLIFELTGRIATMNRTELEVEINGYDEWSKGTRN
jgi:hypothetical protein